MKVKIEVFAAPACRQCASAGDELHMIATSVLGEECLVWREVNVLEEFDYAVALGVLSMPSIAVNGELKFVSLPGPKQFSNMLTSLKPCC